MILFDQNNRVFTLHTKNTTYQMKADQYGVLLHTYYGPRVEEDDLSFLIRYADRGGFSPNLPEAGDRRDYSLDTIPQEYSTCGVGDYRLCSAEVEYADGSILADFRYTGFKIHRGKYSLEGLPAFFGTDWKTLSIRLCDPHTQIEVELLYGVCEEYDLITRAARIINNGNEPVYIKRAMSLCLDLDRADLDLITFNGCHARERYLNRAPLQPGEQGISSTRGTSSHQHNPFVVLCEHEANEDYGICYGAMLLYSGNFQAEAERDPFDHTRLVMGIHPHHFRWKLEYGGCFVTPEAALVCSAKGLASMTHSYHRAIRNYLIRDPYQGERRPVLINNWEATEFTFDAEKLVGIAREASELGVELFVMDDGWFGKRNDDSSGLGDWFVNTEKLPGGVEALVPRIQELGMKFGIWVEPEMVSEDSRLYREHPDWVLHVPGRVPARGRGQLVLDFSRKDVRDHIYSQLKQVLSSADISYVKWDMNRSLTDVWSAVLPAGRQGEVYHRYVLGVYDFLEQLRQDYPHILIEGCSGGGGRFDAGMLYYTPQIWCSDNTDAIDRLKIQYGTSFCYPISTIGAHVSAVPNAQTGRSMPIETRGVVAMCGTFGYEMDLRKCSDEEKETVRCQIEKFKKWSELIHTGDYYRLSDPFQDANYTAWQHVSLDQREALVSLVTGPAQAARPFFTLRLKGLDPALRYRINDGETLYSGRILMYAGYPVPVLQGDYQSVQLFLRAVS